jgi:recyclin-1
MEMVLSHCGVMELMQMARTNKAMREMVYEDGRWVHRLKSMGVWNEAEARRHAVAEASKRAAGKQKEASLGNVVFDVESEANAAGAGFKTEGVVGTAALELEASLEARDAKEDDEDVLAILSRIRSIRGRALYEYARAHRSLNPFYINLLAAQNPGEALLFKKFTEPEGQARMLCQLRALSNADADSGAIGGWARQEKVLAVQNAFESAAVREFEHAIRIISAVGGGDGDLSRVKRYANVLVLLNGGKAAVESWVTGNPVVVRGKEDMYGGGPFGPRECITSAFKGDVNLAPASEYLKGLARATNDQFLEAEKVFPRGVDAITPLVERIMNTVVEKYMSQLFEEARDRSGLEAYLKAVSGAFSLVFRFGDSLKPPATIYPNHAAFMGKMKHLIWRCFSGHTERFLQQEYQNFERSSEKHVEDWERRLREQEDSTEEFFFSNVNRQAAKQDFLSSFKNMLLLPVTAVSSLGGTSKKTTIGSALEGSRSSTPNLYATNSPGRVGTPNPDGTSTPTPGLQGEAPTTELAAKAAMMNFRLQGIKTLFSMEVALDLVRSAKASLERIQPFFRLGNPKSTAIYARGQSEAVFVALVKILGQQHVRRGFDKAVEHLSSYNSRDHSSTTGGGQQSGTGVAPLVTFLELVNVGDLIQQMVDVFYVQELVREKLSDPDDFLGAAVKEKKRFEQMLDESVAAGLNRGIDVLMDEIEVICARTQAQTDFYPERKAANGSSSGPLVMSDVGPTDTAIRVVEVVDGHVKMLTGSTDKNVLDVFNQEVGVRLFTVLCKHIKRQRISVQGSIKFIRYVCLKNINKTNRPVIQTTITLLFEP